MKSLIIILCILNVINGLIIQSNLVVNTNRIRYNHLNNFQLYAKKDKKNKDVTTKGFKKSTTNNNNIIENDLSNSIFNNIENNNNDSLLLDKKNIITEEKQFKTTDDVYKKYGINTDYSSNNNKKKQLKDKRTKEEIPFGEEVLAKVPMKLQRQIDNILITGTFIALSFVVLCGIGKYIFNNKYIISLY